VAKGILCIFSLVFLLGCDCMVTADGVVLDDQTKKPLEGVLVNNLANPGFVEKTKSDGAFSLVEVGRANGKCPEFNLEFSKEGYVTDTIFIKNSAAVTIYLKKK
jgi:hypothetical protein